MEVILFCLVFIFFSVDSGSVVGRVSWGVYSIDTYAVYAYNGFRDVEFGRFGGGMVMVTIVYIV